MLPSGGAELVIIGVGFDASEDVTITVSGREALSSPGGGTSLLAPFETRIGVAQSDGNGFVNGAFDLELSAGVYAVTATGNGGKVAVSPLMVK